MHDELVKRLREADAVEVRHLNATEVYEPFYQWLGKKSTSEEWRALRKLLNELVANCGARMDGGADNEAD